MKQIEELRLEIEKVVGDQVKADKIISLIRQRDNSENESKKMKQKKGIEDAREKGVMFGRPKIKEPSNFREITESYLRGEMTAAVAAKACGMGVSTFYRRMNSIEREEWENEGEKKAE